MKKAEAIEKHLLSKGVAIDSSSPSIFGYAFEGHLDIRNSKKLTFSLLWLGLSKKVMLKISFPMYIRGEEEMVRLYDEHFPEEKSMWGRSTPSFRQAIIDYMRGQKMVAPERQFYIGINEDNMVEIRLHAYGKRRGEEGFLSALAVLEYELEKGQLHRDVLTHLFA